MQNRKLLVVRPDLHSLALPCFKLVQHLGQIASSQAAELGGWEVSADQMKFAVFDVKGLFLYFLYFVLFDFIIV